MLQVNPKKSIRLKNRTKYFDPKRSKSYVRFSSPDSYQSRQIKIEGYETRLYWQYRYCDEHDGAVYFYTLTYNDASIPRHYGVSCFDYEDLRYIFNGGFVKTLLRKYGTRVKYFVGAELGDGKGTRGIHNNPHYHVLFFLEPCPYTYNKYESKQVPVGVYVRNSKYHIKGETKYKTVREKITITVPYTKISSTEFRHLVRLYWQGFDEDTDGYRDYNEAKFGIAREGDNFGLVTDFRAINYVAKYVCKDAGLKMNEDKVERFIRYKYKQEHRNDPELFKGFFRSVVYDMYNTPLNASKTKWSFSEKELIVHLLPNTFDKYFDIYGELPDSVIEVAYVDHVTQIIRQYHLWDKYHEYLEQYIEVKVDEALAEYRNRHCNKCRISQGVGDYALDFIGDKLNPTFQVPDKHGFKNRPMSMYYYRKLFTDVVKPTETSAFGKVREFPPVRVLNEDGIKYKLAHLQSSIVKMAAKAENNLNLILGNPKLFQKMQDSDVNTEVCLTHSELLREYKKVKSDKVNIYERYAQYKLVYEDRYFQIQSLGSDSLPDFPIIDCVRDYEKFLVPSIYSVSRSDLRLDAFLDDNCEDYLPYSQHPYFLRYLSFIRLLDLCSDYFFVQKDNKSQATAEQIAATKRFHSQNKLIQYYSKFK